MLIAGLALFAIPKFKEAQKRQNSARSGQNLKVLNSAVTQYDIEHSGPPKFDGSGPARSTEGPNEIPADGSGGFCNALLTYVEDAAGIWGSPNQPEKNTYRYSIYLSGASTGRAPTLKGLIQSVLDGDPNYEPSGWEGKSITSQGVTGKAVYANGYEDLGRWDPDAPVVRENDTYP